MKTGISVYFGTDIEESERAIDRAGSCGAGMVFTSMHIPEDDGSRYALYAKRLLKRIGDAGMGSIVDIGPETVDQLGLSSIEELSDFGVTHIRLDYGFDAEQTARLSRAFHIVVNASTVTKEDVAAWRSAGAECSRFSACHNYYPKAYSGLSLDTLQRENAWLGAMGFEIIGFVPGDKVRRGPIFEGLPTLEQHRSRASDLALNALELMSGGCDAVIVGDPDISDPCWETLGTLSRGYVDVRCSLDRRYGYLRGQVHHDRPDSSDWVFRSQESRTSLKPAGPIDPDSSAGADRRAGSIAVSNTGYLRYEGELEIARVDMPGDPRMNIAGHVAESDMRLLPYVRRGFGIRVV